MSILSDNIKLIRQIGKVKQKDFAKMFQVTEAMQKSYESGRANPDRLYTQRLATFSGVKEDRLFTRALHEKDIGIRYEFEPEKVENSTSKTANYQEKYIQLLEKQLDTIEQKLLISLDQIATNVLFGRAEIRGAIEYDAIKDSQGDPKKKDAIMVEINKLINLNFSGTVAQDNPMRAGN